jgi:hypothetical protein
MTYMQSWKSLRLTSHTWLGLNPQIGRPLSRIVVPLVYFFYLYMLGTRRSMEEWREVDAMYTDFWKAFDKAHDGLFCVLLSFRMVSFLNGRKQ